MGSVQPQKPFYFNFLRQTGVLGTKRPPFVNLACGSMKKVVFLNMSTLELCDLFYERDVTFAVKLGGSVLREIEGPPPRDVFSSFPKSVH